jgi:Ca-activated chloride channel family protein
MPRRLPTSVGLPAAALAFAALAAAAVPEGADQPFRASIDLVQVWVAVTDANGRLVTGLSRDDFEVADDGVVQTITHFGDERVPVSLGLLVDASDSMRGEGIAQAQAAVGQFLGNLLDPRDEVFVSTFSHTPRVLANWTSPPSRLRSVLAEVRPSGGTAIYDALAAFAPLFARRAHTRTALVVVSDGADTASDASLLEVRDAIRRTDASVYAIAIDAPDALDSTRVSPQALREITAPSGGYTEVVRTPSDLGPATRRIADELNHQYALAYPAPLPLDGAWRSIRVQMRDSRYTARARRGYYAVRRPRP